MFMVPKVFEPLKLYCNYIPVVYYSFFAKYTKNVNISHDIDVKARWHFLCYTVIFNGLALNYDIAKFKKNGLGTGKKQIAYFCFESN